jgi:hypothetical protein
VVIYFVTGLLSCVVVYFQLTWGPGERPDVYLRLGRQVLAAWLVDSRLVLLQALLLVFLAQCYLAYRLIKRMTQGSTLNFASPRGPSYSFENNACGACRCWCKMHCYVPLWVPCLLRWLTHTMLKSHLAPTTDVFLDNVKHTGIPSICS